MSSDDEKFFEKKSGGMTEVARRILLTGLGAIFMTEEGIRKSLGDMKLPKDAVGYVLDTVLKQKDELLGLVATELSKFFSKVKVHEEVQKALSGLQLHLDAKLTFDQKKVHPVSAPKISVKKNPSHE
ncbi:MAG: hypothetical protein K8R69_03465 [Deltaproteobacteria bacterium]|nr:hypothetical protein [Deltaproteobacteria bacterium]